MGGEYWQDMLGCDRKTSNRTFILDLTAQGFKNAPCLLSVFLLATFSNKTSPSSGPLTVVSCIRAGLCNAPVTFATNTGFLACVQLSSPNQASRLRFGTWLVFPC